MDSQHPHRFNIWNLAKPDLQRLRPSSGTQKTAQEADRHAGNSGLLRRAQDIDLIDELSVLETLYNYGPSIAVQLNGTFKTGNGRRIACKTKRISATTMDFGYHGDTHDDTKAACAEIPTGARMDFDLEHVGAVKGVLAAKDVDGFQVAVDRDYKGLLTDRIPEIAKAQNIVIDEICPAAHVRRIEPRRTACTFVDHTGTLRKGRIINLSCVDALIKSAIIPPVASTVIFSGGPPRRAQVMRNFEIGFAAQFSPPIPAEQFSAEIELFDD